nr:monovalent cation/H+ antiporter subunit D [Desulfobulbus sp.]
MMTHWLVVPLVLPLVAAMVNLLLGEREIGRQRLVSLVCASGLLVAAMVLLERAAGGGLTVYRLGNWPAPFGIVLVLDRLSGLLLTTTAVLALLSLLHAVNGDDARGHHFHVFFPIQLLGINGAFLTGDLFNLFVFFEVLLIASYCLSLHGGGPERVRASLRYVALNLIGSALFLLAVGALYGLTGTLNMADLGSKVAAAPVEQVALLRAGGLLLLVVFGLKAAILPLHPWLPPLYGSVLAPVAALFAVMTKVGVYGILRTVTLILPPQGAVGGAIAEVLPLLALLTLAAGGLGVLAAARLRTLIASLVVLSVGALLAGIGQFNAAGIAAALYYLPHTTLVAAGLFLLAEPITCQRGEVEDRFIPGPPLLQPTRLGLLFVLGAVAAAGLPPLSGFIGKLMLLRSVAPADGPWLWIVVLGASLLTLIALSRAGSRLFWGTAGTAGAAGTVGWRQLLPAALLLAASIGMTIAAAPISRYTEAAAHQLLAPQQYIDAVLGASATGGKP